MVPPNQADEVTLDAVEPETASSFDTWIPPLPQCGDTVKPLFVSAWPGNGLSLLVRGTGAGKLSADDLALEGTQGEEIPFAAAASALPRSFAYVVIDGLGEAASVSEELALAGEVIESLPADCSIALFRRCGDLQQVAGVSSDRDLLVSLLDEGSFSCDGDFGLGFDDMLPQVADEVAVAGGTWYPAQRSVVVIAAGADAFVAGADAFVADPADLPLGVDLYVAVAGGPPEDAASDLLHLLPWVPGEDDADVAQTLKQALLAESEGVLAIGACLSDTKAEAVSLVAPDGAVCEIELPEWPEEEAGLACFADDVASGKRNYPRVFRFIMTPEERVVFDDYTKNKIKDDFALSVQVGDSAPVAAKAHIRGQTSLDCARKNFSVDLDHGVPRHLRPYFASDEFYLISMCKDDRYHQQFLANVLASGLGLFLLSMDMVELVVGDESWGVYLLLEKNDLGIIEENSRVKAIIRRRFDPEDKLPDVEFPNGASTEDPVAAGYWNLTSALDGLSGDELISRARELFDLDALLRLVAFHSLTGNGDWVDEVLFYSTESVRGSKAGEWYRFMAWDMDDLYSDCHHSGKWAMKDPHGMVFCAEGDIELLLLADDVVYARYVDVLEDLILYRVTEGVFDAALDQTRGALLPFFDRPEICAAMVELLKSNPGASDPEVAKADILDKMGKLKADFLARRGKLLDLIAKYRAERGE